MAFQKYQMTHKDQDVIFLTLFFCRYSYGKKQAATYRFNRFTVQHNKNLQTHTATDQSQCLQNNKTIQQ